MRLTIPRTGKSLHLRLETTEMTFARGLFLGCAMRGKGISPSVLPFFPVQSFTVTSLTLRMSLPTRMVQGRSGFPPV